MNINYENTQKKYKITKAAKKLLLAALQSVGDLHGLPDNTEVDVTIVDDVSIHKINKEYRQVDRPTDVLSFAFDERAEEEPGLVEVPFHLLGNIIISAETAARQGKEYGHGFNRELAYLAVHGCLHLLGYDHMKPAEKELMREQEEKALARIKLSQADLAAALVETKTAKRLWRRALKAREMAYAPYSKFKVGAAVLTSDNHIYTGSNVENASYGLSMCAERNAIFKAANDGKLKFQCLCVVAEGTKPVAPCGACRQVMEEFGIPWVIMSDTAGQMKVVSLTELLPYGFAKTSLPER